MNKVIQISLLVLGLSIAQSSDANAWFFGGNTAAAECAAIKNSAEYKYGAYAVKAGRFVVDKAAAVITAIKNGSLALDAKYRACLQQNPYRTIAATVYVAVVGGALAVGITQKIQEYRWHKSWQEYEATRKKAQEEQAKRNALKAEVRREIEAEQKQKEADYVYQQKQEAEQPVTSYFLYVN